MSIVKDFVSDCSSVNSDFFPTDKAVALLRDFVADREALIKAQAEAGAVFFNLKLLEEEFRKAYHAVESPFLVSNCVLKVFLAYKLVPEFSILTVKGIFFGLKLYFADIEADDELLRFYREKLARRVRDFDFEIILLVSEYFDLIDDKVKAVLSEMAAKATKELKADPRPKRSVKFIMQLVGRQNLYEDVDWELLVDTAVAQEMFDEAFAFAKPKRNVSVKLLSLMVPSKNSKHMKQLVKAHNLDVDAFPQLFEYLRYGFFKFAVKEIGCDIVEERARLDPKDLSSLIRYLNHAKYRNEAYSIYSRYCSRFELAEFAETFGDPAQFTYKENEAAKNDDFVATSVIRNPECKKEFITLGELGYNEDRVIFVTKANFDEAREAINAAILVGIDSEFASPDCSMFDSQELAIIQIATATHVYIIDCIEMGASFKLSYFIHQLLKNEKVTKAAVGFDSDLRMLSQFFKIEKPYEVKKLISLDELDGAKLGLNALCEKYLLKRVCKLESISAWNQRPLRKAQLHYAALDAAVLLRLVDLMSQKDRILFSPEKASQPVPPIKLQVPNAPNFDETD